MKKFLTLCLASALLFACNTNESTAPVYGDKADVATVDAAQDAINQGSSEITITDPLTEDASLTIPTNYAADETLTITVPANGQDLTIAQGSTGVGSTGNLPVLDLNITDAKDVTLSTPDMSVVVNGDVTGTLTASTADNTLTISAGSTVNTLVVQKGNVRLLGTVTTFGTVASGSNVLYPVSTAAELQERMTVTPYDHITNGGVVFADDIAYIVPADTNIGGIDAISGAQANQDAFRLGAAPTEIQPVPPYSGYIIDGNGHILSGAAFNNVLAVYASNVTVKNLTIRQTTDQKSNQIVKNGATANADNAGISIYGVDNVNLVGVTIEDCGKYGVIVNGSTATAANLTTENNAWGGVNVWNGSLMNEAGRTPGFVLASGSIGEENAIYAQTDSNVTVPAGWTSTPTEDGIVYSPAE